MWIFTTREVSVIIYSIVFLIYVLIKKGKSVFLPVIKAACHIKLIVPFIFIVTMAILIDCQPSLGMLTVNALAAANRIIIPVQAEYLPAKGLEQLLSTVSKVKRQINPKLQIDGILLTMVDNRTNFAKEIAALLRETYGSKIKVFGTEIPHSVRAKEISAEGKSIFAHDPNGKVAERYKSLTKEVLKLEKQREKSRAGSIR